MRRSSIEITLWSIGLFCATFCARNWALGHAAGVSAAQIRPGSPGPSLIRSSFRHRAAAGDVIGRLEIPDIGLLVPVLAGDETESLRRGVFHIKGTATLGGLGTVGLAGHRDTYFRPLRKAAPHMTIQAVDETGVYHYEIDSTEIVTPDRVDVLSVQDRPELTLITCFPFDFVGAAPKRFIVHAHLLSAAPDARRM